MIFRIVTDTYDSRSMENTLAMCTGRLVSRLTSQRTKKFKPLHKPEAATTEEILLSNKASKKYNTAVIRARKVNVPATATTAQIFLQNTDRTTDRAPGHRFIQDCQMFVNVVATYTYPTYVEAKVTTANSGPVHQVQQG